MEWVTKNPNWYEGAMQHTPSTINSLEATNRVIKDQFTLRERLSLGEFVTVLEQMIGQFSRRCKTDLKYQVTKKSGDKRWLKSLCSCPFFFKKNLFVNMWWASLFAWQRFSYRKTQKMLSFRASANQVEQQRQRKL